MEILFHINKSVVHGAPTPDYSRNISGDFQLMTIYIADWQQELLDNPPRFAKLNLTTEEWREMVLEELDPELGSGPVPSGPDHHMWGKSQTEKHIRNRSRALKGRVPGFAGKKHKKETIEKLKSVTRTQEHKNAISKAIKGRTGTFKGMSHKKKKCPHCKKKVSVNTYPRWHGDNCKWQK